MKHTLLLALLITIASCNSYKGEIIEQPNNCYQGTGSFFIKNTTSDEIRSYTIEEYNVYQDFSDHEAKELFKEKKHTTTSIVKNVHPGEMKELGCGKNMFYVGTGMVINTYKYKIVGSVAANK